MFIYVDIEEDDDDDDYQLPLRELNKTKKRRRHIIDERVTAVMDRGMTSCREGARLIDVIIRSAGGDPNGYFISKSTVHKHRAVKRHNIAKKIEKKLEVSVFFF